MNKNKIANITVGTDPEFFLFSQLENKFISPVGMFKGSKHEPQPITDNGHAIQIDGVSVEFNIPPCRTAADYHKEIKFVVDYIKNTIATPRNLIVSNAATAMFTNDQLDCPEAWEIGCMPDINAWTLNINNPKNYDSNLRASGGHVAVGYDNPNEEVSLNLIKAMDLFLAVPSVLLDKDNRRRELYGKAGAMRFTPFGCEFRTLSNFWIFNEELTKWVFNQTIKACEFVNIDGFISNQDEIIECINTGNKELAKEILDDYKIELPELQEEYKNEFA